jgi:ABC-2 type transport system permease protein
VKTLGDYLDTVGSPELHATPPTDMAAAETIDVCADALQPQSSFEVCFPLGIIWGMLGLAAELAIGTAREREAGTLLRLRVAPVSRLHLFAGRGLASFLAGVGVMAFLLTTGWIGFGIRFHSLAVLSLAVLCVASCFVGITLFISVLGRTESAVSGAAWACLLVMAMIGGGMVPQMFMPAWMERAGDFSPIKWAILGLEGAIWRGFSLWEMRWPCGILLLQGGVLALAGMFLQRRTER